MRYLRARGSARFRRFSFTSMVWCLSHCAQASFETCSQIRLPSSPGYGGKSSPSASRPSLTHFTIRGIGGLYALQKDLRTAPPVVERLALRGQRRDVPGTKALLEKPVRGMRRQREELAQLQRLGALLAGMQQPLAVARAAILGRYRRAGELLALRVGKRVERRAAADRAVVLDDDEVADLGFQQLAASFHQRAVGFERLDEREHAADVLDARRPQLLERIGGDHRADAGVREKLEQQRAGPAARTPMRAAGARAARPPRVLDRPGGLGGQVAFSHERFSLARGELAHHLPPPVARQLVGEHEELLGA